MKLLKKKKKKKDEQEKKESVRQLGDSKPGCRCATMEMQMLLGVGPQQLLASLEALST